jgi:hypothetical protein
MSEDPFFFFGFVVSKVLQDRFLDFILELVCLLPRRSGVTYLSPLAYKLVSAGYGT